jgi:hypothetical protein
VKTALGKELKRASLRRSFCGRSGQQQAPQRRGAGQREGA